MIFSPSRSTALEQLKAFVPHAAKYTSTRNFVISAEKHTGVSQLSPYIRMRLVTEEESTCAVLAVHSPRAAEKFLQEIAWRTYWKGWLEMRPEVWQDYRADLVALAKIKNLPAFTNAISGNTGIDCFDHWVTELVQTGYLHNHARMWFASIWIFTLRLPWQLGADFFMHHLLDADPAANTLSWRWVAGIHTPGKHYLARASNISQYTNGQYNPTGQLNESAAPLPIDKIYEKQPLVLPHLTSAKGRVGHLMFPEDLAAPPEECGEIHATAAYLPDAHQTSPLVTEFLNGAIDDTLGTRNGTRLGADFAASLSSWISNERLDTVLISQPTVGLTRDFLAAQQLPQITQYFVRRWDRQLWPHATAGFFKFKKALPKIHASLAPSRENDLFPDL